MKKLGIGLAALVVVTVLGTWGLNTALVDRFSRQTMENVNTLSRENGSDIRLELVSLQKGLTRSVVEWKVDLGLLGEELGVEALYLTDHIRPGFMELVSRTRLDKTPGYKRWIQDELGGKEPLSIETRFKWNGDMASTLTLTRFQLEDPDGESLVVRPGTITTRINGAMDHMESQGEMGGVVFSDVFKLDDLSFEMVQERVSSRIWTGRSVFSIGELFFSNDLDEFWLNKVWAKSRLSLDPDKEQLNLDMVYGMDRAVFPDLELGKSQMGFQVNQVDVAGYEQMMALYLNMLTDTRLSPESDPVVDAWMARNQPKIMAALESMLNQGLAFEIKDVKLALPQGDVLADLSLTLNRDTTFAQLMPIANAPETALDIFSITSGVRLPAGFATDYPFLTQPLYQGMATGLFVLQGDELRLGLDTRDGRLYLNGNEMSLDP